MDIIKICDIKLRVKRRITMNIAEHRALRAIARSMLALRKGVYTTPEESAHRLLAIEELRVAQFQTQSSIEKSVGFQTKGSWWNLSELMKLEERVQKVLILRHGWIPVDNTARPPAQT
ncbi:MAG: hypothetical protein RLZZ234_19 [Candidatus Parcubacteria bacterium]|jgi:hypothetical protein